MRFAGWTVLLSALILPVGAGCATDSAKPAGSDSLAADVQPDSECSGSGCAVHDAFGDAPNGPDSSGSEAPGAPDLPDSSFSDVDGLADVSGDVPTPPDNAAMDVTDAAEDVSAGDGFDVLATDLNGGETADLQSPDDGGSEDVAWLDAWPSDLPDAGMVEVNDAAGQDAAGETGLPPFDVPVPDSWDASGPDLQDSWLPDQPEVLADAPPDIAPDLADGSIPVPDEWIVPDLADVSPGDLTDVPVPSDVPLDEGPEAEAPPDPQVLFLSVEKSNAMVLGVRVRFYTTSPATGSVTVIPEDGEPAWHVEEPTGYSDTLHSFLVTGLRAGKEYKFQAEAEDGLGAYGASPVVEYKVPELPKGLPTVQLTFWEPALKAPGLTYVSMLKWDPFVDLQWGYTAAYDDKGEVRWYTPNMCMDFHFMASGNMLCLPTVNNLIEINPLGETVAEWSPPMLGVDSIHHAAIELPDGNLVLLSTELRFIDGYPTAGGGKTTYPVVGDVVVEFTRKGVVVGVWKVLDYLDPYTYTSGFNDTFWNNQYKVSGGVKDWSHGNSLFYDEQEDELIVSLRHQSMVIALGRSDGLLHWRFGEGGDFSLEGPGEFQVWQHSAELTSDRTLILFDNGNIKPGGAVSRAVEFDLGTKDAEAGPWTAQQVWSFEDDEPFFSPVLSEVDELSNGNILVVDSSRVDDPTKDPFSPWNHKWARVVEVTRDNPPIKVWELRLPPASCFGSEGYWIPKAERAPVPESRSELAQ